MALVIVVTSLVLNTGFRHESFNSWSVRAQPLWLVGFAALWHVESSPTRDWTCVLCIGSWILIHCTTREVLLPRSWLPSIFKKHFCFYYLLLLLGSFCPNTVSLKKKKKRNHFTAVPVGLGGGSRNENSSANFNHFQSESHLTILQMRQLRQVK